VEESERGVHGEEESDMSIDGIIGLVVLIFIVGALLGGTGVSGLFFFTEWRRPRRRR
jgi:hypothetical protein